MTKNKKEKLIAFGNLLCERLSEPKEQVTPSGLVVPAEYDETPVDMKVLSSGWDDIEKGEIIVVAPDAWIEYEYHNKILYIISRESAVLLVKEQ